MQIWQEEKYFIKYFFKDKLGGRAHVLRKTTRVKTIRPEEIDVFFFRNTLYPLYN